MKVAHQIIILPHCYVFHYIIVLSLYRVLSCLHIEQTTPITLLLIISTLTANVFLFRQVYAYKPAVFLLAIRLFYLFLKYVYVCSLLWQLLATQIFIAVPICKHLFISIIQVQAVVC